MMRSRLYDALGFTGDTMFHIARTPDGTPDLVDDDIVSVRLTRGSGAVVGVTKNTATMRIRGAEYPLLFDAATCSISLTQAGRAAIVAKTGGYDGSPWYEDILHRWHGRIAGQKVTDGGDRRKAQWVTDLICSDTFPIVEAINAGARATKSSPRIDALVQDMLTRSGVAQPRALQAFGSAYDSVYFKSGDPSTKTYPVSTVTGHFIGDVGTLFRTTRNGTPQLLNVAWRRNLASNYVITAPYPITRTTARSPIAWTQRVTMPAGVHWDQWDGTGWNIWIGSNNPAVGKWPVENIDMTDIVVQGDSPLAPAMTARMYRSSRSKYVLDTLKFDLLDLLNRPNPDERKLAALLLSVEPGDPLALANDWPYPTPYNEIGTVTRITETITANQWTVDIDLAPIEWATGEGYGFDSKTWDYGYVHGQTWDGTLHRRWNEAP